MRILPILPIREEPEVKLGSTQVLPFVGLPFRLGPQELKSHIHCIGLTGQGKSKLLASYASQLILQNRAVAVVDPHADLAHDVLALLLKDGFFRRKHARKKLLYVDFSNRRASLPFNVLRQPYPVDEVARLVVEACTRAWPALADGQAPRFENILLAAIPVLIANELPLTQMGNLLADKQYRERLLKQVADPQIVSFFHDRFDQWGRETPLMVESTLSRVFLLSYSPALRYALSQSDNALNFRDLMDSQTSVIFNLGGLDEVTQKLLGCLVTVGYEVAALSRADILEEKRTPYHLIMDEFASFSAQSEEALARMLSLTRKYGLFCVLAHQTFSQLSARLAGAMQNTLQISFRIGREDSVWAAPRFGSFDPLTVKHVVEDDTAEPRTHPVFLSVQETYEGWAKALESLKPREAFVRVKGKTVKIRTHTIKHQVPWGEIEKLREAYALQLLTPRAALTGTPLPVNTPKNTAANNPANTFKKTLEEPAPAHAHATMHASAGDPAAATLRMVPLSLSPAPAPAPTSHTSHAAPPSSAELGSKKRSKRVKRALTALKPANRQMQGKGGETGVVAVIRPLRRGIGLV